MSFIKQMTSSMYNVGDATSCIYARAYRPNELLGLDIAGVGVSALGSAFGGMFGASAAEKARRQMEETNASKNAWWRRARNESYLDTSAGQYAINQAKKYGDSLVKKANGQAALGGATDSSVALAKQNANSSVANVIGNLSAQDTARRDSADRQHMQDMDQYSQQKIAVENQRNNNIATAASGLSNSVMNATSLLGSGTSTKSSVGVPKARIEEVV